MTHRGRIFIALLVQVTKVMMGLKRNISHRNLGLHGHCDKGLHQGVQRCIQAEETKFIHEQFLVKVL